MKVTFLGQAGLLFDFDGLRVMVDPYFSNSVGKLRPEKNRRQKSEMSFLEKKPDVLIRYNGKVYYITGDTLRSRRVTESLGCQPDVVFLPINGVGNNMNMADAAAFATEIGAKQAVPLHFGMFDDLDPEGFVFENRVIPEIWKEISL
jgi:L-ascorbate metabolism protein UlaG (beta-lactamase superfamily)